MDLSALLLPLPAGLLAVGLAALLLAAALGGRSPTWWVVAILAIAATLAARLLGHGGLASGLGAAGELAVLALVALSGTSQARAAARLWALVLVPAIVAVAIGSAVIGHGHPAAPWDRIAVGLLILGFAVKLALVPLYVWLPTVARAVPAVTLILVLGVVDTAVLADLADLSRAAPWIVTDHAALWTGLAALSLLGGAVLALAETDLKVILAFVGVADAGLLLLGLLAADPVAATGTDVGLIGKALAETALFGAVACGETALGRPLSIADTRGLAGRLPVASAVFMVGAAAVVGLPPSLGFSAHWRLFRAAAEIGGPAMLALVFVAASLLLLVMVRALHRVWLGPSDDVATPAAPVAARAVLVAVAIAIVASGLVPRLFETAPETAPHALAATTLAPTLALAEGTAP